MELPPNRGYRAANHANGAAMGNRNTTRFRPATTAGEDSASARARERRGRGRGRVAGGLAGNSIARSRDCNDGRLHIKASPRLLFTIAIITGAITTEAQPPAVKLVCNRVVAGPVSRLAMLPA